MSIPYIPGQRGAARVTMDWRGYAACRYADPRLFFPAGTDGPAQVEANRAKQVCAGCPVQAACLDSALSSGYETGVWGGTTEGERRALRAQRVPG
jgi:WhiB family transcriptional regulator, redox-sensing transcriptional regulator